MTNLLVGQDILERELIKNASPDNLKNSTYDLTIGDIVPVGSSAVKQRRKNGAAERYFIHPREMVLVLSKETFNLPATVTGHANLRTTFTKDGLLALNVGIIDPFFSGPISTALLNFSDRPVEIHVGQKFFRVLFFEHDDISEFKPIKDESLQSGQYLIELEKKAFSEFPKTYLNVPADDSEFYFRNFWKLVGFGFWHGWQGKVALAIVIVLFWYLFSATDFLDFLVQKYKLVRDLIP